MASTAPSNPDFLSLNEFAQAVGVSYRNVFAQMQEGRLPVPVVRIGSLWRIPRPAYERWLATVSGDANEIPEQRAAVELVR